MRNSGPSAFMFSFGKIRAGERHLRVADEHDLEQHGRAEQAESGMRERERPADDEDEERQRRGQRRDRESEERGSADAGEELPLVLAPGQLESPARAQFHGDADGVTEPGQERAEEQRLHRQQALRRDAQRARRRGRRCRTARSGTSPGRRRRARQRQPMDAAAPHHRQREEEAGPGRGVARRSPSWRSRWRAASGGASRPAPAAAHGGESARIREVGGGRDEQDEREHDAGAPRQQAGSAGDAARKSADVMASARRWRDVIRPRGASAMMRPTAVS